MLFALEVQILGVFWLKIPEDCLPFIIIDIMERIFKIEIPVYSHCLQIMGSCFPVMVVVVWDQ